MHPMLNIAIRAARNAGDLIQRSSENVSQLTISKKSQNDFVSEVDRVAEQEIIQVIKYAFPDHSI
ncbi:MAG: inositol monophosphatase, partial [Methylococcaceae bacterium]|nr:inositol monophosphatase [Methylococcaceae bacterium]